MPSGPVPAANKRKAPATGSVHAVGAGRCDRFTAATKGFPGSVEASGRRVGAALARARRRTVLKPTFKAPDGLSNVSQAVVRRGRGG